MRVGFDGRWYNQSGVGVYVHNLLQELERVDSGDFELIVYEDRNNPVPVTGKRIRKSELRGGKYTIQGQLELAHHCTRDQLDLFHAPFYIVPILARCPVVVTIHDLIPFLFPIYGPVHTQLVRIGYRIAIHKANKIIAVSQTTVSDLQKILSVPSEQIAMVYNACAEALFFPRNGIGEMSYLEERYGIVQPYVLTLSAGNWRTKNLDTALAAIELARSHTGMSFQTVVAGPHEGLSASGMKDKVSNLVATGFIESEDLPKLYRNASAFVTVSRYEGFGIPLVEAMACGCPCVTSTGGSLAEVAGNAAPIFGPDDAEGMAGAIAMLLKDSDYRSDLSSRGVRRAAEFSYTRAARETLEVYRDVASRH